MHYRICTISLEIRELKIIHFYHCHCLLSSLCCCLAVMKNGGWTSEIHSMCSKQLMLKDQLNIEHTILAEGIRYACIFINLMTEKNDKCLLLNR